MDVRTRAACMRAFSAALLACTATLLLSVAIAEPESERPFSAVERKALDDAADAVEKGCNSMLADPALPKLASPGGVLDKLASAVRSPAYCSCGGQHFRTDTTPALLRHGTQEQEAAFLKSVFNNCAVAQLKIVWPEIIRNLAQGFGASESNKEQAQKVLDAVFACVQPNIDALTGDTLGETMRQTAADYEVYRRNPAAGLPPGSTDRPLSLVRALRSCIEQTKQKK